MRYSVQKKRFRYQPGSEHRLTGIDFPDMKMTFDYNDTTTNIRLQILD